MSYEGSEPEIKPVRGWREYLCQGLSAAHKRRPASFYTLLSIPVVLLLGIKMAEPGLPASRFAFTLAMLFIFLGVVIFRAVKDMAEIGRQHLREHHATFRTTLGEPSFLEALRASQDAGERK